MKTALVDTATRRMRVRAGDVLEGTEGSSVARIEITYLGRGYCDVLIVARALPGKDERLWTLRWRDWRRVRRGGAA